MIDLAPHVDVAGKEIWTDPSFNLIYRNNFHDLEAFDPFQVNFRSRVNLAGLDNVNACTFFRLEIVKDFGTMRRCERR